MNDVFRACGKTPERGNMLTTSRRSEDKQSETLSFKKIVGKISRQEVCGSQMLFDVFNVLLVEWIKSHY